MTKIFLPSVHKQDEVSGQASFNLKRDQLFLLLKNHPDQQRKIMNRHPLLDEAAQIKAEDMAKRLYLSHTSPDGLTANENIVLTGYKIPDYYSKKGNNGESLYRGHNGEKINRPVDGWYNSPHHKIHVFGTDNFFKDQECIGVGWAESFDDYAYVVFISMPCES